MPVSRLISDLDLLHSKLNAEGPVDAKIHDELRLTVARIKELRRQLDIAQFKLDSVVSLAGKKTVDRKAGSDSVPDKFKQRFKLPNDLSTGISEIDEAHRALFEAGNHLYWLTLLRDVDTAEAETALTRLVISVKTAFAVEEQMMAASHYSQLDQHRAIHQRMKNYLAEMNELVFSEPLAVVVKLEKFLGSWFPWHLQVNDIEFTKTLKCELKDSVNESALEGEQSNNNRPSSAENPVPPGIETALNSEQEALMDSTAKPIAETVPVENSERPGKENTEKRTGRNPARELGFIFRGLLSSWLLRWREKRHVVRSCRAILSQYKSIRKSQPDLSANEVYCFVVMSYTDCDTDTATQILSRAEESFAEWPVARDLNLRDVVHYLAVTEYFDLYGKDFWMRSEIGDVVNTYIPEDI